MASKCLKAGSLDYNVYLVSFDQSTFVDRTIKESRSNFIYSTVQETQGAILKDQIERLLKADYHQYLAIANLSVTKLDGIEMSKGGLFKIGETVEAEVAIKS